MGNAMYIAHGTPCHKCKKMITTDEPGRRFRMKPVHEKCLPLTRQKKIKMKK